MMAKCFQPCEAATFAYTPRHRADRPINPSKGLRTQRRFLSISFLPTYNHQIEQRFAALPLLQLGLDVDHLPALPRGAARGGDGGRLVPIGAPGRSLGTPGRGLGGRGRRWDFRAPSATHLSGGDAVLACTAATNRKNIRPKHGFIFSTRATRTREAAVTWERQSPSSASCR